MFFYANCCMTVPFIVIFLLGIFNKKRSKSSEENIYNFYVHTCT